MIKSNFTLIALVLPAILSAQHRYFDPVFPEVKLTTDIIYGINKGHEDFNPFLSETAFIG